jgi:antitoxin MazE
MRLPLRKWGNSLGIRIPKMFAVALNIREGEELDVRLEQNAIILSPPNASLDALLKNITEENLHEETDTGMRTGREIW